MASSFLLHTLTSRMGTGVRAKTLAEERKGKLIYLGEEILVCAFFVGETAFHTERREEIPFPSYPCSRPALWSRKAKTEPLGSWTEVLLTRLHPGSFFYWLFLTWVFLKHLREAQYSDAWSLGFTTLESEL